MEATEKDLKDELLSEASKYPGKHILIHGEDKDGKLTTEWVKLDKDSVKTPKEVYDDLKKEGYKVDYQRVPVTDEKTPEADDLEALTKRVGKAGPDTPQIFNCHAGRGRTTTAMVAAQLIQDAKTRAKEGGQEPKFHRIPAVRQDIKEQGDYEKGEYRLILRTIQALDNGLDSKSKTDEVLDRTQDMQNLRTEIKKLKDKSEDPTRDAQSRYSAHERGKDYLHRYHTLITFEEYCKDQADKGFKVPYGKWLEGKPELSKMLESIELAYNPAQSGGAQFA
jgi:hypothetical protein